jgi:hypothetical protein
VVYSTIKTYLLCSALFHIKINVLQIGTLCNLPMNTTDGGFWVRTCDIYLEIANTSQKVVLVNIPDVTLSARASSEVET